MRRAAALAAALVALPLLSVGTPIAFTPCPGSAEMAQSVDIAPYPATAGQALSITATVTPSVPLPQGSSVRMQFMLGPLTSPSKHFDLCAVASDACPVAAGTTTTLTLAHDISPAARGGVAKGTVEVLDDAGAQLACVNMDFEIV